jgi:hypothetical protein
MWSDAFVFGAAWSPKLTMAANERLSAERAHFKASLSTALKEDDDPLAAYDQFVKWTVKNYADGDPSSGLRELLQEATAAFKSDPVYKTDLRYLKLWILYIRQLTRVDAVATFAFLLANGIGASYSILYEEYAAILELDGRWAILLFACAVGIHVKLGTLKPRPCIRKASNDKSAHWND